MIYKILLKTNKTAKTYTFYSQQINSEVVEYSTTNIEDLKTMYKSLLENYTMDQIKLVHELEPEVVINVTEEGPIGD